VAGQTAPPSATSPLCGLLRPYAGRWCASARRSFPPGRVTSCDDDDRGSAAQPMVQDATNGCGPSLMFVHRRPVTTRPVVGRPVEAGQRHTPSDLRHASCTKPLPQSSVRAALNPQGHSTAVFGDWSSGGPNIISDGHQNGGSRPAQSRAARRAGIIVISSRTLPLVEDSSCRCAHRPGVAVDDRTATWFESRPRRPTRSPPRRVGQGRNS